MDTHETAESVAAPFDGAIEPGSKSPRRAFHPTVMMLTYLFPPSFAGGTRQAIELAKGLRREGVETIFLGANFLNAPPQGIHEGFQVYRFSTWRGPRLQYLIYALKVCVHLFRRRKTYDLALLHSTRPFTFLVLWLLKVLNKPALMTLTLIGNDDPASLRKKSFLWKLEARAMRRFDKIICKSSAIRDICLKELLPLEKLAAIPNGTELRRFRPAHDRQEGAALRREMSIAENAFVVMFVGRISRRKGCDVLLHAWEQVIPQMPDGLLVLIGPKNSVEGDEFQNYIQEVSAHAAERRVIFCGELEHTKVADFMRLADCFVFPSQREGLPNSVIEAMACGLPVMCANIPGVTSDLIEHERDGLIFEPHSASELAALILALKHDPLLRKRLGENATQKARAVFSIDVVAAQHRQLYSELVRTRTSLKKMKSTPWN